MTDWAHIVLRWTVAGARPGVIEWTITDSSASARFISAHGADAVDLVAPVSLVKADGLVHIDCGSALSATIRLGDGASPAVLYARTSMLARLGVPGGRARIESCAVEPNARARVVRRGRVSSS